MLKHQTPVSLLSLALVAVAIMVSGCAATAPGPRPSIAELFEEAAAGVEAQKRASADVIARRRQESTETIDASHTTTLPSFTNLPEVPSQAMDSKNLAAVNSVLPTHSYKNRRAESPPPRFLSDVVSASYAAPWQESIDSGESPTANEEAPAAVLQWPPPELLMEATPFDPNRSENKLPDSIPAPASREPQVPRNAAPPSLALPQQDNREYLINEFFDQSEIREAINIVAEIAGKSVILEEQIGGSVTVQIRSNDFEDALEALLLPLGLVFAKVDDTYLIASPDPDSTFFHLIAKRRHFQPQYRNSADLVDLLPARYKEYYRIIESRNIIAIEAPENTLNELTEQLTELDQPVPQVVLEAVVCVTSPDSEFRFGLDWNHVLTVNSANQLDVGLSGLAFSGAVSPAGARNAFSDAAVTSAFLQLLSQEGYVTIRSAPRTIAKDNEKALISIARETFFSLQPTSSNVLFRQDVQKVDSGIVLEFTPRIHGDIVSLDIHRAEVSEDIRSSTANSEFDTNPFPIINRRSVETKVDVRDGQTIAIGGLLQRQKIRRTNEVPGLSAIPGIGKLFTTSEEQDYEVEVAIFISPKILRTE